MAGSMPRVIVLATAGAVFAFAAAAAEITELPPGPDRDLVAKVCQSCHHLQMVFDAAGISRQEWDMSLDLSGSLPAQNHDRPLIDGRL